MKKFFLIALSAYTIQSYATDAATTTSSIKANVAATHAQGKGTSKAIQEHIKAAKATKASKNNKEMTNMIKALKKAGKLQDQTNKALADASATTPSKSKTK